MRHARDAALQMRKPATRAGSRVRHTLELNFWKAAGPARKSLHFCQGTSGSTDSGSSAGEKAEDQTWGVGLHE